MTICARVRVHDQTGDDLGIVHLPGPVEPGDLVATEHEEFRVVAVVVSPPGSAIDVLAKVQPMHLRVAAI
jgi:hypothetical protein